ncbi:flagellar assembly protein A [Massilia pseudoviolaceinigra]|uniref:flagellar assembly protein A n=1 Tax=Massilia pseudoviolaceinigra TaxID=3057165 RepID=UPI002796A96E|nr:flagellar assembly protein A [Massilia sp. CCM 9206]MDQ1918995.1 FapA family protein [Massilia sp. CCM 9206]
MSIESSGLSAPRSPAVAGDAQLELDHCIIKRPDGVYGDPSVLGTTFGAAIDRIFATSYLVDLDYPLMIKAIYGAGAPLPRSPDGHMIIRLASDIQPFSPLRRPLYKAVKINRGKAEYFFEPVYVPDPDDPEGPEILAQLDVDEFIADMWGKGIRFGIDVEAVRQAIDAGKSERVVVASLLEPRPGRDAHVIEVTSDLHRSDAPLQLANGKLDLMAFQNRFPQVDKGVRLLKKVPRVPGTAGFELSGLRIDPPIPNDTEVAPMAGEGTVVEVSGEGEFLIAQQAGFLNVDSATGRISVGDKIVSRDGVSARTTGNLKLAGDFEEFGEVQEKRVVEGEGITIHADVFGSIISRGGAVLLNRNLVGGSAHNARGDIRVKGVASGSVIQASLGEVVINRAESCIVSGTRVTITHAVNCEIMADEVVISQAEGCAIAARTVAINSAGPRRQSEMSIFALQPDTARLDEVIAAMSARVEQFGELAARRKAEMEAMTNEPEVRKYVMLASKVRKKELILTEEQVPMFQKMALAVGPALKAIAKVSLDVKAAETEQQAGAALVAELVRQRSDSTGVSSVAVKRLEGETVVRSMTYNPDGTSIYDFPAKDIKLKLRTKRAVGDVILVAEEGAVDWQSGASGA